MTVAIILPDELADDCISDNLGKLSFRDRADASDMAAVVETVGLVANMVTILASAASLPAIFKRIVQWTMKSGLNQSSSTEVLVRFHSGSTATVNLRDAAPEEIAGIIARLASETTTTDSNE